MIGCQILGKRKAVFFSITMYSIRQPFAEPGQPETGVYGRYDVCLKALITFIHGMAGSIAILSPGLNPFHRSAHFYNYSSSFVSN